jgi:allantoicase
MPSFTDLPDLASARLGGTVLHANDEFFAPKENLLQDAPPVFRPGEYTDRGKWMDGWETRRRREPGHDWCILRLGLPGVVRGVVVDTRFFEGNYPPQCSLDGVELPGHARVRDLLAADLPWHPLLPRTPVQGNCKNELPVEDATGRVTHLRFSIYPDGGVARLRVHGEVVPERERLVRLAARGTEVDLAALEHGGQVVDASDMFFGHRHNLILPGPPLSMADGWETRRRRGPGHDWAVVRLGIPGTPRRIEVDTTHFKGNAPGACSLEGAAADPGEAPSRWRELLPRTDLEPHTCHGFEAELVPLDRVTHVRLHIYPDGGVGRLRVFGVPAPVDEGGR